LGAAVRPPDAVFFATEMDEIGVCCYQLCQNQGAAALAGASLAQGLFLMVLRFQPMRSNIQLRWAIKAAAVAGLLLAGAGARDARSEPFSALAGSWSGAGTIKKSNGGSERIRCRSTFEPAGAVNLSLRLRCASDSYNFDLSARVAYQGGTISGSWQESSRNVNGGISGHSAGDGRQVQAVAQGAGVTSNITLTTRGNHQSVLIQTPGAEVQEIAVSLEKK